MWRRWFNTGVFGLYLLSLCVGMTSGCAVFRATGRSVEAVGEGACHAVAGTGDAIKDAASETKRDIRGR
jgi:hypothetical protein